MSNNEEIETSETIQNEMLNVPTYLKELKDAIENQDSLSVSDINDKLTLAYKIASIYSNQDSDPEEIKVRRSEELSGIMSELGKIAKRKKADEQTQKEIPKPVESGSGLSEPEPKETVKEKTIPKPVFEEPIAETTVKSAVSSTEPTKEQIDEAIAIQNKPDVNIEKIDVTVIREPEPVFFKQTTTAKAEEVTVGQYEDATIVSSEPKQPEQKEIPKPVVDEENDKLEMEIDSPSIEQQIFVSDDTDTSKKESTESNNNLDYSFLDNNKPFEGDDDLDTQDDIDLSNVVFEDKPSDKELRERRISQEFSEVPEGMQMLNIKSISRKKISDTLKALSKIKTDGLDISKVNMYDYNEGDEIIRREYLKTRNDMIATPKVSRIALLMSGHYEEISSYSNYDLVSIERNISNPDVSFVDRELLMLNSIYQHVKYVSYAAEKPSFEEWCKNIMYPDMSSLYFGVYDANSVGNNNYTLGCPYCGENVTVAKPNRDLTVAVPNDLTYDTLDKFITAKDIMKLDTTEIAKWAKNTKVMKLLKNSKIIIEYTVPTIFDYLVVLNTAQKISRRDLGDSLDLSAIDIFNAEGKESDATRILGYLYVKSIAIPAQVEGTNRFRYIRLTSKADIIEHINGLDSEDYREIFTGQKVQDLFIKTATRYYLEDVECTNPDCKKKIKYVSLDPKSIFFFKIGEERNRLMKKVPKVLRYENLILSLMMIYHYH